MNTENQTQQVQDQQQQTPQTNDAQADHRDAMDSESAPTSDVREPEYYDESALCERELAPLIEQIEKICNEHKLPFIVSVSAASKSSEEGVMYKTTLSAGMFGAGRAPDHYIVAITALKDGVGAAHRVASKMIMPGIVEKLLNSLSGEDNTRGEAEGKGESESLN